MTTDRQGANRQIDKYIGDIENAHTCAMYNVDVRSTYLNNLFWKSEMHSFIGKNAHKKEKMYEI